jgi:hypothetical protein
VLKQNGVPYPGTVLIDGEPVRSTTGTFILGSTRADGAFSDQSALHREKGKMDGIDTAVQMRPLIKRSMRSLRTRSLLLSESHSRDSLKK